MTSQEHTERNNVFEWFCQSHAIDRIIFLTDLIQFCLPLELQFLCTCVRHLVSEEDRLMDTVALDCSDTELSSTIDLAIDNDAAQLNSACRSRLLTVLSLMKEKDHKRAQIYYQFLMNAVFPREDDEMVLMLVMAQRHPAFAGHMQRMLTTRTQSLFPEMSKGHLSIEDESLPGTIQSPKSYDHRSGISTALICDYRSMDTLSADNPFTLSTDSVEIYVFWKNSFVTSIRRGICDFHEFKRILELCFGSEIIPELEIPTNIILEPHRLLNLLNDFLGNIFALPSNISNSSVVYEFLLAVHPDFIVNDSFCTTFVSADGTEHKFPKHAVIIHHCSDFSQPDAVQKTLSNLETKMASLVMKKYVKPTLTDDLLNAAEFILNNKQYITFQDIDDVFDEGSSAAIFNTNVPEKIRSKIGWSLSILRKWHLILMTQASVKPIPPIAPAFTSTHILPDTIIAPNAYQQYRLMQQPSIGMYPDDRHKVVAWTPLFPLLPPIFRSPPSVNFQPTWPYNCYPPPDICPNIIHKSNRIINGVLNNPTSQEPVANNQHISGASQLIYLNDLYTLATSNRAYCCKCGGAGHYGHECKDSDRDPVK